MLNNMKLRKILVAGMMCLLITQARSQFVNSIGLTVGGTAANQKFFFYDPGAISAKKYVFGLNASVFGEFMSRDYVRWVSEIQFNQKGSIDKQPEANYANRLQYISWNNYLKIRYELYSCIPYILIGPRLEYDLTQATASPTITGKFLPLHVSLAVGGGAELITYSNWKFFAEAFYNPDVMPAYVRPELHVLNKAIELRVGVKYQFGKAREACNTPTYVE